MDAKTIMLAALSLGGLTLAVIIWKDRKPLRPSEKPDDGSFHLSQWRLEPELEIKPPRSVIVAPFVRTAQWIYTLCLIGLVLIAFYVNSKDSPNSSLVFPVLLFGFLALFPLVILIVIWRQVSRDTHLLRFGTPTGAKVLSVRSQTSKGVTTFAYRLRYEFLGILYEQEVSDGFGDVRSAMRLKVGDEITILLDPKLPTSCQVFRFIAAKLGEPVGE